MKTYALALAAITSFAATSAMAETMIEDADGDGSYSYDELLAAFPDLTEDVFEQIDTTGDALVDADELKAAQDAELIES